MTKTQLVLLILFRQATLKKVFLVKEQLEKFTKKAPFIPATANTTARTFTVKVTAYKTLQIHALQVALSVETKAHLFTSS